MYLILFDSEFVENILRFSCTNYRNPILTVSAVVFVRFLRKCCTFEKTRMIGQPDCSVTLTLVTSMTGRPTDRQTDRRTDSQNYKCIYHALQQRRLCYLS